MNEVGEGLWVINAFFFIKMAGFSEENLVGVVLTLLLGMKSFRQRKCMELVIKYGT